ncbi:MAG TPA: hypothetical protein VFX97_16740 [Pyrinomonadaceae bacterium]|nr:hypothetical protein [Pyrinomonadaceae bacterium]
MEAFKQMLGELATSKKFMAMIVGVIVAAGAKYGLDLDPAMVNGILALFVAYILGQGLQGFNKDAARIAAVSAASLSEPSTPKADKAVAAMSESVAAKE